MSQTFGRMNPELALQKSNQALLNVQNELSPADQQLLNQMLAAANQPEGLDVYDAQTQTAPVKGGQHPFAEAQQFVREGGTLQPKKPKGLWGRFDNWVNAFWTISLLDLLHAGKSKPEEKLIIKGLDTSKYALKGIKGFIIEMFPSLAKDSVTGVGKSPVLNTVIGQVKLENISRNKTQKLTWMARQLEGAGSFKKAMLSPFVKLGQLGHWVTNHINQYGQKVIDYSTTALNSVKKSGIYTQGVEKATTLATKNISVAGKSGTLRSLFTAAKSLFTKVGGTRVLGVVKDAARTFGYSGKIGALAAAIAVGVTVLKGAYNVFFGKGDSPYYGTSQSPDHFAPSPYYDA